MARRTQSLQLPYVGSYFYLPRAGIDAVDSQSDLEVRQLAPIRLPKSQQTLFNAKLFPKLEILRLFRRDMDEALEFHESYTNLLGPSLKTFCWDFAPLR